MAKAPRDSRDLATELGLVSEETYARYRGVQIDTLRQERARRRGPEFVKLGKTIFYTMAGIQADAARRTVDPGAAPPPPRTRRGRPPKTAGAQVRP